jgi:hypothetical protein
MSALTLALSAVACVGLTGVVVGLPLWVTGLVGNRFGADSGESASSSAESAVSADEDN